MTPTRRLRSEASACAPVAQLRELVAFEQRAQLIELVAVPRRGARPRLKLLVPRGTQRLHVLALGLGRRPQRVCIRLPTCDVGMGDVRARTQRGWQQRVGAVAEFARDQVDGAVLFTEQLAEGFIDPTL